MNEKPIGVFDSGVGGLTEGRHGQEISPDDRAGTVFAPARRRGAGAAGGDGALAAGPDTPRPVAPVRKRL